MKIEDVLKKVNHKNAIDYNYCDDKYHWLHDYLEYRGANTLDNHDILEAHLNKLYLEIKERN